MNGNQSAEISPIKSDQTENKAGKNVKPRKVYVQARYKDVNKSSTSYSFSREMKKSVANKENPTFCNNSGSIVKKNRAAVPIVKGLMQAANKPFPRLGIHSANLKLSKEKCYVNEPMKPLLKENKSINKNEETFKKKPCQSSLDLAYCQYLQSAFLANHLMAAVNTQKDNFLERYQQLETEEKRAIVSLNVLQAYKNADDLIKKKNYAVDKLSGSLDVSDCLERLCQDLELSANLVEVDSGLDLGPKVPDELLVVDKYLQDQDEVIEKAQIEDLFRLESNLVSVRQRMAEQSQQISSLKNLAVTTCTKIVSGVSKDTYSKAAHRISNHSLDIRDTGWLYLLCNLS